MKNKGLIWKILIPLFIIGAVLYLYYSNRQKHNWNETYKSKSKEPYGCYMIVEMLKAQKNADYKELGNAPSAELGKASRKTEAQTYVFIGEQILLSNAEIDTLMSFISKGNHGFIAAKQLPSRMMDTLLNNNGCGEMSFGFESSENYKLVENFNFYDDTLKRKGGYTYSFLEKNKPQEYNWQFVDGTYFCDTANSVNYISYLGDNFVNCMTFYFGEGTITIHTNPVMFTNAIMKHPEHFEYADKVFSHVPLEHILWDESSKYPYYKNDDPGSSTPLKYILSQPALRAGWYTLLALSILFIIFRAKRRIRTIPVIERPVNNSLAFLKTVAALFQQAEDHKKIAEMKMKYFLAFLFDRYSYTHDVISRNDFHEVLSLRSGVDKDLIKTIFTEYNTIKEMNDITSFRLEDFNNLIHVFYVRCR